MAKGRYVAFLDADDYWAAGKLKKQTDAMERTGCVFKLYGKRADDSSGRTDRTDHSGKRRNHLP